MIYIMPSIDISDGKAVKRIRGIRGSGIVVGNPIDIASKLYSDGYEYIHVVDLDAAEGRGDNENIIKEIVKIGFKWIQVGGGIRSIEKASRLLSYNVSAIVISTIFYTDTNLFRAILNSIGGEKILVAIDYNSNGNVYIAGWNRGVTTIASALDMIRNYNILGTLFTYISNEGTVKGIDRSICFYASKLDILKEYAGGVSSIEDLVYLKSCGFRFAVIGMALYQGILRGVKYV
ncbi:1-(5-phosphoribosyl)-5-((5-phosphoribosylamino)methylideneamino) imidazole-4-carboxamide isomerase [Ignisphaera aggregans DSM 17230]|uniref:1-(5-phosphoribosyl)-5-[(5-phosphoribosylamino)methylideneamino] imidazole-4-carboxamide isomerase n=1 Tax=Ignisphaera aggregans (strain DSM 17230 / JCM 13409 / AQ1.S1) TaxID=583356 RepID=E0SRC5_IGNAA|nr:1-(5-phosphoribosyl)-5-((5-phosphoribosylamino)methylideneamino) imidazole-4-carboxamide isomerase [Ignisphaera aggregans DSM 17230]